jgi:hypothetical protein
MMANSDCGLGGIGSAVVMYAGPVAWVVEREEEGSWTDAELRVDAAPWTDTERLRLDGCGGGKIRTFGAIEIVFPIGRERCERFFFRDKRGAMVGFPYSRALASVEADIHLLHRHGCTTGL